ncbi:MAG: hypothetical protein ACI30K_02835, partial [Muribaculaceae bacterium]
IDVLFSRISESGSAANERDGASAGKERQAVEERKKKALELWAKSSATTPASCDAAPAAAF